MRRILGLACLLLALLALLPSASAQMPAGASGSRGQWTCSLDSIAATLTECVFTPAAPTTGLRAYITTIVAQSTTATGGLVALRTGTGANCGTGTANLLPGSTATPRYGYPANTAPPLVVLFSSPLGAPTDTKICVIGTAVNTVTIDITGFYNP